MPALYDYKVEIEGNQGFILDTDLLDTGVLGFLSTDITSYVRSVRCKRGKSTSLDEFTAGQMTVVLDNRSRAFDPNYTSSPLYGAIVPRRKMKFSIKNKTATDYIPQFSGFIDDWSFDYDVSGESTATASCSDAFTLFANQNITLTSPAAELTGDRIQRVLQLSDVAFSGAYSQTGAAFTVNNVSYTGAALAYMQSAASCERGYFFINPLGNAEYVGWNYFVAGIDPQIIFSDYRVDLGAMGTGGIPFTNLQNIYGTEQLYNYVTVQSPAGTVTAQDTTSQVSYGITDGSFDVITAGTAEMQVLANYVITNYKEPRFRISEVSVSLDDPLVRNLYSQSGLDMVLYCDIADRVAVYYTPNQISPSVQTTGFVIGKSIEADPGQCNISFSISSNELRSTYP